MAITQTISQIMKCGTWTLARGSGIINFQRYAEVIYGWSPSKNGRSRRGECTSDCISDPNFNCGGKRQTGAVYVFRYMKDGMAMVFLFLGNKFIHIFQAVQSRQNLERVQGGEPRVKRLKVPLTFTIHIICQNVINIYNNNEEWQVSALGASFAVAT